MKRILFNPIDTLFFRDGRPYNQFEPQTDVSSQFPPFSTTLIGAFRAAMARGQGWQKGDWPQSIKDVLGNRDNLNGIGFTGPHLLREEKSNQEPLFPAPLHLLGKAEDENKTGEDQPEHWRCLTRLVPGRGLICDLDSENPVRLPAPEEPDEGLKTLEGNWLTLKGMNRVLKGDRPDDDDIIHKNDLWRMESRTGNVRDADTRVVKDDHALYSSNHVRLYDNITLALTLQGWKPENDWQPLNLAPLGGESRMVDINLSDADISLPARPEIKTANSKLCYIVIFITPADLGNGGLPAHHQEGFLGLPGKLISCCLGKPLRAGGWDSVKKKPLALKPLLPAGSVLFMETMEEDKSRVEALHSAQIGQRTAWGFGQILVGTWENKL